MLAVSLLAHALLLAFLLITLPHTKPPPEEAVPPAVSVIFEGGAKQKPSQPTPAPDETAPAMPTPAPSPEKPPEPAPPPPAAQVPPQPQAPPQPEEVPQPEQPEETPQPEETQPEPPQPEAPQPAQVQPAPPQPMPPAPPRVEFVLPNPAQAAPFQLPELPPPPPAPPRPRASPRPPARPRAAAPPQARPEPRSEFTPMFRNYSLGGQQPPSTLQGLGPHVAGPPSMAPSDIKGAEALGPDWRNLLMAWVETHKYYPEAAAMNGEDGSPSVEVTVNRDGRVQSVELIDRSGSRWLDLALTGLFRNAKLPPFPDTAKKDQVTFDFTMHYILIRR